MKLNFDQVMIFSSIDKKQGEIRNIRKSFADFIYTEETGVLARAVATKIFNADDETEFTPVECALIREYSQHLPANLMDAIEEMIDSNQEEGAPEEKIQ